MTEKNYLAYLSEVVETCSVKWSHKKQVYLDDCDSNWYTNMFLDYCNNYISQDTFIQNEIMPRIECNAITDEIQIKRAAGNMLDMFRGISGCRPMMSFERVGEVCINILKEGF